MTEIEFWDRAFLKALQQLVQAGKPTTNSYTAAREAGEIATAALKQRRAAIRELRPLGVEKTEDNGTVKSS